MHVAKSVFFVHVFYRIKLTPKPGEAKPFAKAPLFARYGYLVVVHQTTQKRNYKQTKQNTAPMLI